jgi:hypothetical protein
MSGPGITRVNQELSPMKYLIILSLAFAAANALAAKPTYISQGKVLTPSEALRAALDKKTVLGCRPVVAKISPSGTSIGLKNKVSDE